MKITIHRVSTKIVKVKMDDRTYRLVINGNKTNWCRLQEQLIWKIGLVPPLCMMGRTDYTISMIWCVVYETQREISKMVSSEDSDSVTFDWWAKFDKDGNGIE